MYEYAHFNDRVDYVFPARNPTFGKIFGAYNDSNLDPVETVKMCHF